jgi:hypothetical protein
MMGQSSRAVAQGLLSAALALPVTGCGAGKPAPASVVPTDRSAHVTIRHLPEPLLTVTEGAFAEVATTPADGHANTQNLTWLVHLVITSTERVPLAIEHVDALFTQDGQPVWAESFSRQYLERLEWIRGDFDMTPEYYITRVLHGAEERGSPDVPPNGAMSLVRLSFARPWFARANGVEFRFRFKGPSGQVLTAAHAIAIGDYRQRTPLRLPFRGVWAVNVGNDLSTGHRRSGLNGLTSYGWDFVKLGPDGAPFRRDGRTPEDFYTFGESVLAAADGTVVDVRDDIGPFGIGQAPDAEALRKDGDLFSGNLVVIDHRNGEYTLTCHLLAHTVTVRVGDRVRAGQVIAKVGISGFAGVPHIHLNLITGPKWLAARGLPSLFSDFERMRTGAPPQTIALGNPMTGWLVRNHRQ